MTTTETPRNAHQSGMNRAEVHIAQHGLDWTLRQANTFEQTTSPNDGLDADWTRGYVAQARYLAGRWLDADESEAAPLSASAQREISGARTPSSKPWPYGS